MALSQLECLDDSHVYERLTDVKAEFYYSEEQRAALEALVARGPPGYQELLKTNKSVNFLSSHELRQLRAAWTQYVEAEAPTGDGAASKVPRADSLAYWPNKSDTEIPPLDLGWPQSGAYRGLNRFLVYTHPPKENAPHIKAVIRQLVQQAQKVVAVVMDLFTDRDVFRDVLDAASRRRVPVYMILDQEGVKLFIEMCQSLELERYKLMNLRVRYVSGVGFYMPSGKIPGTLSHKFIMVDGDKVAFGSFRLTWSSLRLDRNLMTFISGQNVEMFDIEFRELYAISEEVNLYKELNIPDYRPSPRPGVGSRDYGDGLNYAPTVARKMINPKYMLVVGPGLAPGEMIRWGGAHKPPAAHGNQSVDDGGSESQKRLEKFLEDLETVKQDNSDIPPVEEPQDRNLRKNGRSAKLSPDLRPKWEPGKDGGEILVPNGVTEPKQARASKKFSSLFRRRKRSNPLPQDQLLEGFVVLNKPENNELTQTQSVHGSSNFRSMDSIHFQSSENKTGNASPKSTRSHKPRSADKCIVS
ncbi:protein FAM83F [Pleurodeles waltl]|uniref:protein FAM83F n=1 Tax=Pleurodeles waltl TaxID=8319 RepID=UPI0037094EC8